MVKCISIQALNCFFSPDLGISKHLWGLDPLGGISRWLLRPSRPPQRKNFSTPPDSSSRISCPRKRGIAPAVTVMPIKCLTEVITLATEPVQPPSKAQSCVCFAGTNSKAFGLRKEESPVVPTRSVIPCFSPHY